MIWELSKSVLIVGISVLLTLIVLKLKSSPQCVEVDIAKLIGQQAFVLGKQNLPEEEIQKQVANFMPRVKFLIKQMAQQNKVMIVMKGTTLSPLPDWTDRIAQRLEDGK